MKLPSTMVFAALAAVLALGAATALAQGADIVAVREEGMKGVAANAKAIKTALDGGAALGPLAAQAAEIAAWGRKIPSMFPPGSDTGKTEALPTVWTDKAGFDRHAADLAAAADRLATALAANDAAAAKTAFNATGGACAACHRGYRQKKS